MILRRISCVCIPILAFVLGWWLYPYLFPYEEERIVQEKPVAPEPVKEEPKVVEIKEEPKIVQQEEEKPEVQPLPIDDDDDEEELVDDTSKMKRRTKSGRSQVERHVAKLIKKKEKDGAFVADDLSASDWKDPEALEKKLAAELSKKTKDHSDKGIFEFLSAPQNRLDLARLDLIRKVSPGILKRTVEGTPQAADLLATLGNDLNWLENFMYSGPLEQGDKALEILTKLGEADPDAWKDETLRRIASVTALEFARGGQSPERAVTRYRYYADSWKAKKLNKNFDKLHYWDTRIVVGCGSYDSFGNEKSLAWQRDNVRLPSSLYTGAAYQVPYRLRGVAGDTVFNEDYYSPFRPFFNNIQAEVTREVGAVCGGLSHFGAYAALANGLPAMTMGEPGHCSYTVRVNGKWEKCNSIYWQKSPHWKLIGERTWDFLLLTEDLYSDFGRTRVSDEVMALKRAFMAEGNVRLALNTDELAVVAQPKNYPAWQEVASDFAKNAGEDAEWWKDLHEIALNGLADSHGEACATLLRQYFYPAMCPMMKDRRALLALYAQFLKRLENMGDNRWEIGKLLTTEFNSIENNKKDKIQYLQQTLKILLERPAFAGPVLAWGLEATAGQDEDVQEAFQRMVVNTMKRSKRGDKDMWETCGEAMYTASANKDRTTFQTIGSLVAKKYKNKFPKKKIKFTKFSGTLLSAKGLITSIATIDPGGGVCLHWGVLQPTGGSIKAKFSGEGGVTVELEYPGKLSGVVVAFPSKNDVVNPGMYGAAGVSAGAKPFHLRVSDNGTDWEKVATIETPDDAVLRFDLRKVQPRARYVQIIRDGDMIETTISGFYVYGRTMR